MTILAPILMSFSRNVVSDQCFTDLGRARPDGLSPRRIISGKAGVVVRTRHGATNNLRHAIRLSGRILWPLAIRVNLLCVVVV